MERKEAIEEGKGRSMEVNADSLDVGIMPVKENRARGYDG